MTTEEVTVQGLVPVAQSEIAMLLEAGYLFLEMSRPKEAEEIFAGVAALLPHSATPLICQGTLAFAQGRFDRALKMHRDALKREPDNALAHAHAGESLLFLRRMDDARTELKRATELDPNGAAGQFAQSLLDALNEGVL